MNYPKWYSYEVKINSKKGNSSIKVEETWTRKMFQDRNENLSDFERFYQ